MNELDIRASAVVPLVLKSHVEWWDDIIGVETTHGVGTPGGSWINISGVPGAGKSLFCIQILDGFAHNRRAYTDYFDFENGKQTLLRYMKLMGSTKIHNIVEASAEHLLGRIRIKAQECLDKKIMYVLVIDSINECEPNLTKARQLSEELLQIVKKFPNIIVITVAHLTKGKKVLAGPAEFSRRSSCNLLIENMDVFRVLNQTKNRFSTGKSDPIKLMITKGEGWSRSTEPDFITKNPVVQFVRKYWK
jgi:predicted ATP-dependent serine protease